MLKNYLKTSIRNLWTRKGTTLINVCGLTLGIAGSLVLFLLIHHHASFDTFHSKHDRIYRIATKTKTNDSYKFTSGVPSVLPEALRNDFPQAEEVVFTSYRAGAMISVPQEGGESKKYDEKSGVVFTQPQFFRIFDRPVLSGDISQALDDPHEAVISRKLALKYFNREDVMGELVRYDTNEFRISAVVADFPSNTDFPFELLLSYATITRASEGDWHNIWSDEHCYFLLAEGADVKTIESGLPVFTRKYLGDGKDQRRTFLIQPLSEIHSNEDFGNYNYNTFPRPAMISLSIVAVFLVLTACINFINLATAEAIKRSKEVGIRKTLGSSRFQLIQQFLGETSLVTLFSVFIALGTAQLALGFLNPYLEQNIAIDFSEFAIWIFLGGVTLVVSLFSGLYPSFVVSSFRPALALKNLVNNKTSSGFILRRVLVVTQFFISQVFIIGTIVMIKQMDYLNSKDLGFDKDAVITVPVPRPDQQPGGGMIDRLKTFREEVSRLAGVEMASLNTAPPTSGHVSGTNFRVAGKEDDFATQVKLVDGNYIDLFNLTIVAGHKIGDLDTAAGFIVNEELVSTVGLESPEEIIGTEIELWDQRLPIVGVVKNFHTMSLSKSIEPLILMNRVRTYQFLAVKLNPADMQATIRQVQSKWESLFPDGIFKYEFLDEEIRGFYDGQRRMSVLLGTFTTMAIFIGCLGLFGLATFMANQRTKEIGVRKVLGASVSSIVLIFSREFALLILLGFVLAAPVAWFIMNEFLSLFAYKTTIGAPVFAMGIGITLFIAMVTVGYRSFRAATANPVESLKCE